MDAPFHFFGNGQTIDQIDIDVCIGPALLVTIPGSRNEIDMADLKPFAGDLRRLRRLVLNTGWYRRWGRDDYFTAHPVLTPAAAAYLVDSGLQLIGIDFPSVDRPPHAVHLELLGNGIVIVENLTNLDRIPGPEFELVALPLAIAGRDGSPVRAVARLNV
jgi:kynurenine formamidase